MNEKSGYHDHLNYFHFYISYHYCCYYKSWGREKCPRYVIMVEVLANNSFSDCQWTIGSYVSVRSSIYEVLGKLGEHERCVRVASWVLSKLPKCFISRWTHSWRMNRLFYNIFNPMVCWFDLFANVMSVHNKNMMHTRTIEFDETNLLAML